MEQPERKWTLVIDLDKCTGCAACVVACHAENNVPIVTEREVVPYCASSVETRRASRYAPPMPVCTASERT
jgi:Fe-S-cluster-containing dehydrogenase component